MAGPKRDDQIVDFIRDPKKPALTNEQVDVLFREINPKNPGENPVFIDPHNAETVREEVISRFGEALRQSLKQDFAKDGKASMAILLDISAALLNGSTAKMPESDAKRSAIQEIRHTLKAELSLNLTRESLIRKRLDDLSQQLEPTQTAVHQEGLRSALRDLVTHKRLALTVGLSVSLLVFGTAVSWTLWQGQQYHKDHLQLIEQDLDEVKRVNSELLAYLADKRADEDPTKKELPEHLRKQLPLLSKQDDPQMQALAAIGSKDFEKADAIIQKIKKEQNARQFEILTLEGDNWYQAGQFDKAIQPYEDALALQQNNPEARHNFASALIKANQGNSKAYLTRAIQLLNANLAHFKDHSYQWANTFNTLGIALSDLGIRSSGEKGNQLLEESVSAYQAALKVFTREDLTQDWAMTQNNLGNVLSNLGVRKPGAEGNQLLEEAASIYRTVLEVFTRETLPKDWAATQNNLGTVLWRLGVRKPGAAGDQLLEEAASAFTSALKVYTRQDLPHFWAMSQGNLGTVLSTLGRRKPGAAGNQLLKESVSAYRALLEIFTRKDTPQDWALVQNNLGNVLSNLGVREPGTAGNELLEEAVSAYRAALKIRTREDLLQDWAMTQNNLGNVLSNLGRRKPGKEGNQLLEEAASAYRAALKIRTREELPQDWAMTKNNLGLVLSVLGARIPGNEDKLLLDEAVSAYRAALEVRTPKDLPQGWAITQNNLADAYIALQKWTDASEVLLSLFQHDTDNAEVLLKLNSVLHDRLFNYKKVFALDQDFLQRNPENFEILSNFAESHLTTGRFAEAEKRFDRLLQNSNIDTGTAIALRVLKIVAVQAQHKTDKSIALLEELSQRVTELPDDFILTWGFAGTRHFIASDKMLKRQNWLLDFIEAFEGKNSKSMLEAIQDAKLRLKHPA
ncbi:MAG: hypothetical protein ACU85E_10975 [Gammaproteobacteria bacterium]